MTASANEFRACKIISRNWGKRENTYVARYVYVRMSGFSRQRWVLFPLGLDIADSEGEWIGFSQTANFFPFCGHAGLSNRWDYTQTFSSSFVWDSIRVLYILQNFIQQQQQYSDIHLTHTLQEWIRKNGWNSTLTCKSVLTPLGIIYLYYGTYYYAWMFPLFCFLRLKKKLAQWHKKLQGF